MIRKLKQSNSNQAVLSNDSELDLSNNTESNDVKLPDLKIPSKTILNNTDLKRLKGFTQIRKKLKQDAMKKDFIDQVSAVLDLFESSSNKYEHEIVSFVCSVAEDWFISHKQMGDLKEQSVIECCSRYFNNDVDLVKKIIQIVLPTVPKTNIIRRNKQKIISFFFGLVEKFSST
jgi:hypothetical protein